MVGGRARFVWWSVVGGWGGHSSPLVGFCGMWAVVLGVIVVVCGRPESFVVVVASLTWFGDGVVVGRRVVVVVGGVVLVVVVVGGVVRVVVVG